MGVKVRQSGQWVQVDGSGGGSLNEIEVVQYADEGNPRTEYGCSNPISVITSAGITTIGIGSTSNAYGRRFYQETEPTSSCDGDLWFSSSGSSGSSSSLLSTAKTASGTETEFEFTDVPSWANKITVMFLRTRLSGASSSDLFRIQLGTSSAYVTSNYVSTSIDETEASGNASSISSIILRTGTSGIFYGQFHITKFSSSAYVWNGSFRSTTQSGMVAYGGVTGISGTITKIKIFSTGSTTFTTGSQINILYEG